MILHKVAYKARLLMSGLRFFTGTGNALLRNRPGASILIYHGIDHVGSTQFNTRFISQQMFERQVAYFKKHFNIISLDDYFDQKFDPKRFNICLTFDDGYRNNLTLALPILEQYQVPAAFFITGIRDLGEDILWPDFLDLASSRTKEPIEIDGVVFKKKKNEYFNAEGIRLKTIAKQKDTAFKRKVMAAFQPYADFKKDENLLIYWEQLTVQEIQELGASPLCTIGSHGYFHNNKGLIDTESACDAVLKSKLFLENTLQKPIKSIAWPDGSYNDEVVKYASNIGLCQQLLVLYNHPKDAENQHLRERFGINPFISFEQQIAAILKGRY